MTEYTDQLILISEKDIRQSIALAGEPLIVTLPEVSLDKIIELLSLERICGITGPAINANARELNSIKDLCQGNHIPVHTFTPAIPWEELKTGPDGLIPVVVEDYKTREVLMVAYMNKDA